MEYELSELASTLIPHAVALAGWAIEHNPAIDASRQAYDEARPALDGRNGAPAGLDP